MRELTRGASSPSTIFPVTTPNPGTKHVDGRAKSALPRHLARTCVTSLMAPKSPFLRHLPGHQDYPAVLGAQALPGDPIKTEAKALRRDLETTPHLGEIPSPHLVFSTSNPRSRSMCGSSFLEKGVCLLSVSDLYTQRARGLAPGTPVSIKAKV